MESCSEVCCPHLSLPVEMDESMTSSSLNLAWPVCQKCSVHFDDVTPARGDITHNDEREVECPDACFRRRDLATFPEAARRVNRLWNVPSEDEESLEPPLSLRSYEGESESRIARFGPTHSHAQCPRCPPPPVNMLKLHMNEQQNRMQGAASVATPQATTRARNTPEVMSEFCVLPSQPIRMDRCLVQEIKRTISLPEDCRTVFLTYSVDVAEEIFPFVQVLINQGFRPAIDIFDNAVRQMDVNKWMDSYLKNKSVLIIMVISPKYKTDIEGDGLDQHGLHTKYIHSQLQNEFIQQRCLNFRVVPVLFPTANQSHVPMWLQSTRVFRWPHDVHDLLLRLLREERYIAPPLGRELTISIRPL